MIIPSNVSGESAPRGSYYFNSGSYLTANSATSTLAFGTSDYTVETWFNRDASSSSCVLITGSPNTFAFRLGANYGGYNNGLQITLAWSSDFDSCSYSFSPNTWYHVVVQRASGTVSFYINGIKQTTNNTGQSGYNWGGTSFTRLAAGAYSYGEIFQGYLSNTRVVKGAAIYSGSSFTVPTSPLSAISGTEFLSAQSPTAFVDASPNNWALTAGGSPTASTLNPF